MMRNPLRKAARVHKNERGAILFDESRNARVNFFPHLVGSDRAEFACRDFHGEINFAALRNVHKDGLRPAVSNQKLADQFHPDQLAQVRDEHTPSGKHVNHIIEYPKWVPAEILEEAKLLAMQEAEALLKDFIAKPRARP